MSNKTLIGNCAKRVLTNVFKKLKIKIMKQQTAMQELKEDLFETLTTSKEALEEVKNKSSAKEIYKYVEATLKLIIQEIDNDYILKRKKQIIEARVKKPLDLEYKEAEQYYEETYTQSSE